MMNKKLQKIIWLGNPYFARELHNFDWDTVYIEHVCVDGVQIIYTWDILVQKAGFEPDLVIVGDRSMMPFVLGVESFPCLTVFYCIDTHIKNFHFQYAQGFDICLVSLYDHIPLMLNKYLQKEQVWWFPAYAPNIEEFPALLPNAEVEFCWDCLFVGNLATPDRINFLNELKEYIPTLHITSGNYKLLFPKGRIIINESSRGDLNFRVFEALGSGACLVTPNVGHKMLSLFEDGVHLCTYAQSDAKEAAKVIQCLLDNPEKQDQMRQAALKVINNKHRAIDRAREFSFKIRAYYADGGQERMLRRRADAHIILKDWLKLPYLLFAKNAENDNVCNFYMDAAQGKYNKS